MVLSIKPRASPVVNMCYHAKLHPLPKYKFKILISYLLFVYQTVFPLRLECCMQNLPPILFIWIVFVFCLIDIFDDPFIHWKKYMLTSFEFLHAFQFYLIDYTNQHQLPSLNVCPLDLPCKILTFQIIIPLLPLYSSQCVLEFSVFSLSNHPGNTEWLCLFHSEVKQ